ncbi:unnamed protein product [Paramecium primaurelia]|uniref:Serine aminopeptidase S33 domain-containing protein n=1 Tax=Paramecium primaurelia TaxID=5886 RepID=A0A8S1Q2J2_PARPR|nr:unnamed protein product [Paramecium primaurelia]
MQFFQKSEEQIRIEQKLQRINAAKQEEKYRKPNPCQVTFPEENFIEMKVQQEGKLIKLNTYRFQANGKPKAVIFMFHGLCAHINHCAHIAQKMAQDGFLVVGFDNRGFGKSEGIRGYLESLEIHLSDCRLFMQKVLELQGNSNIPVFLSGLSMGGMTSFRLAIQGNIPNLRGIILYAPAIKTLFSNLQINTIKFVGYIIPKYKLIKPKRGQTTKNPQVTEDLMKDPYTYSDELLPKTISTITVSMKECESMYGQLQTPWIVIQGGLDKLVDPDLAFTLQKESPSKDKTVLYYENLWHDVWHEEEIHDIIPKVIQWLNQRI